MSAVFASDKLDSNSNFKDHLRQAVTQKVSRNWTPVRSSKVVPIKLKFRLYKNGSVSNIVVCKSDSISFGGEQKAIVAVLKSAPFEPFPPGSPEFVEMELQFETTTTLQMTVPQAIDQYGPQTRKILSRQCKLAGITYPPKRLTLIGLKHEKKLLLFGGDKQMKLIGSYPLVSYSGVIGPKLKEGDQQIPEGIYHITGFQAYSMLCLNVDYPNELDRKNAKADHRTKLGGDILVHGGSQSTGCLVISNDDMEQVFVAVHDVGRKNTELIIAPCNLTQTQPAIDWKTQPKWLRDLYKTIEARMLLTLKAHK